MLFCLLLKTFLNILSILRFMKKVIVTGANGMLGSSIIKEFEGEYKFYSVDKDPLEPILPNPFQVDLTDKKKVEEALTKIKPDLVIHCAALTNVDFCEDNREMCYKVNVDATKYLAEICKKLGIVLVYISTDFVFDGEKGNYKEEDETNPLGIYAESKLLGEKAVIDSGVTYIIPRTSIYGWNIQKKESLVEWIINANKQKKVLNLITDQYFTPIFTNNLAQVIFELYETKKFGLFNIAGAEKASKYDFAMETAEVFNLDKSMIQKISMDKIPFKSKRPRDASLNIEKIKKTLKKTKLLNIKEGLLMMKSREE
jgi:dTDP-4-dehydrorhamnose reductase